MQGKDTQGANEAEGNNLVYRRFRSKASPQVAEGETTKRRADDAIGRTWPQERWRLPSGDRQLRNGCGAHEVAATRPRDVTARTCPSEASPRSPRRSRPP